MPEVTLAEFLYARIAEDQADALNWQRRVVNDEFPRGAYEFLVKRVKAECKAKLLLLEWLGAGPLTTDAEAGYSLRVMASPYAAHQDYREEWKP